jgi:hypothetical protein
MKTSERFISEFRFQNSDLISDWGNPRFNLKSEI